jgi:hypothetical protein
MLLSNQGDSSPAGRRHGGLLFPFIDIPNQNRRFCMGWVNKGVIRRVTGVLLSGDDDDASLPAFQTSRS